MVTNLPSRLTSFSLQFSLLSCRSQKRWDSQHRGLRLHFVVCMVMVLGIEGTQINEIICVLFMFQVIFKCQRILAESLSPNRKALFSPASMLKSIHCAMLCWMGKRRCHASLKVIQCQLIGKLNAKSKKYEPKRTKRRTPTPSWRKWKEITKWAHVESSKLVSLPKNCWRTIF